MGSLQYEYLYSKKISPIDYTENDVTIEYKCITPNSKGVKYYYKLVGADTDWQITESTTTRYPELDYGDYLFKIKAKDIFGNISKEKTLTFTILPPWYHTWWARIIGLGIFGISVLGIIRYREIRLRRKEEAKSEIEKRFAELELTALQSQMNPHFVFNTLNGLQKLINRGEEKKADEYIIKFSSLVRQFLSASQHKFISLTEELDMLEKYVVIEQLRFEHEIDFKIVNEVLDDGDRLMVPSTLLQPFVENSINHGLFHKSDDGYIRIRIYREDELLKIALEDNGVGRKESEIINKKRKNHISFATKSIKEKAELLQKLKLMNVKVEFVDKYDSEGEAAGTKVLISLQDLNH